MTIIILIFLQQGNVLNQHQIVSIEPNIFIYFSMFDQRMLRPKSDQFYFQIQPTLLTLLHPKPSKTNKDQTVSYKLKITKGNQFCDELKKNIQVKASTEKVVFQKSQLTFYLSSYHPSRNVQFKLILFKYNHQGQQTQEGSYSIKSGDFISKFLEEHTKLFSQVVPFGNQYELNFNIYMDKSRIELQKFIRQIREKEKQTKISGLKNSNEIKLQFNHPKSQILSQSEKAEVIIPGANRFGSPLRRLERKQKTNRSIKMQNSPHKSKDKDSEHSQEIKFIKVNSMKGSERKREGKMSLAEKQIQIQFSEEDKQKNQKLKREKQIIEEREKQILQEIEMQRSRKKKSSDVDNSVKVVRPNSFESSGILDAPTDKSVKKQRRKPEKEDNIIRRTNSTLYSEGGSVIKSKKKEEVSKYSQNKKENIQKVEQQRNEKGSVILIVFLIASFFLLYHAMIPSRKI